MTVGGAAKPARDPGSQPSNKPPQGRGIAGGSPTPLDSLFILFASCFLLLLLLWIASVINGDEKFTRLPEWVNGAVKPVWKVLTGAGAAGTLALRKWFYKSAPSPNYLLWIPGFTFLLLALLYLAKLMVPAVASWPTILRAPVRFCFDRQLEYADPALAKFKDGVTFFSLWEDEPLPGVPSHGVFNRGEDPRHPYPDTLSVSSAGNTLAWVKLSPAVRFAGTGEEKSPLNQPGVARTAGSDKPADYEICLKLNAHHPGAAEGARIVLRCSNEQCAPDQDGDPGYVLSGNCTHAARNGWITSVLAAEPVQQRREPGWDAPSLPVLEAMQDNERFGYTRFYVSFTTLGQAANADQYYFALRVNDQPIYIDGLSPELKRYPLQRGATNWISFGLENLNFTGRNAGKEKLHLTFVFLQDGKEIRREELEREYVALRTATEIPPIQKESGVFNWTGAYVVPRNQDKYELFLGSSTKPELAMNAKAEFDKLKLSVQNYPAVMVVRPPLPSKNNPNYGMVVGLVMPTSQVKFTFNAEGSHDLCQWAAENAGKGAAGKLIRHDYSRYEIAANKAVPCN